ncbi:hypothetical protein [Paracoccus chinensis]|uniref:Uncharacterized protein n=1 Tax=Paracoccus chinensis TaxID=525640 RepID=A0A1G9NBH1_9RHOB|nr:hypothetical protein [Paracoccus chinensis]SDL83794.1 hypothetical protein SAMN04487971_12815 [Paracoccus chinensis]
MAKTYRSAEDTILLLRLLMLRASQSRARVSKKTIMHLASRKRLRAAFLSPLMEIGLEEGLLLVELDSGMFAVVNLSALEGAKVVTGKQVFTDQERRAITDGSIDMDQIAKELGDDEDDEEDDEAE